MSSLTIEIPEEVLLASGQSREEFLREARFLLASRLFELGRVSAGKAAKLCGMDLAEFLLAAGRSGIAVADLDPVEERREFEDA